jgi:hypothetical protein
VRRRDGWPEASHACGGLDERGFEIGADDPDPIDRNGEAGDARL